MKKKRFCELCFGFMLTFIICGMLLFNTATAPVGATSSKTGTGLAEHVLNAYSENWKYSYGNYGQLNGGIRSSDCSGLIKSYLWWTGNESNPNPALVSVAGSANSMLASASEKGNIVSSDSSTIPRIHGLILYSPGHVGVYVGNNMAVDNRCTGQNIKYQSVSSYHWKIWFKLPQIKYPDTGFETFNGKRYYYENGQYVVNTTKTIDGKSYTFDSSGVLVNSEDGTETVSSDTSYTTLQEKSRGSEVLKLQNCLISSGYMFESSTGYYGNVTKTAVSAFQKAAGLSVTGTADTQTQAALYSAAANT